MLGGPGGPSASYRGPSECIRVLLKVRGYFLWTFWRFNESFVIQCLKVPNHCARGALGGPHGSKRGLLRAPRGPTHSPRSLLYKCLMTSWRFVTSLLKFTYSLCLGGLRGACQGPRRGYDFKSGTTFQLSENFTVIHLIFAEIFVPQDFTIRAAPGFMGPANMCGLQQHKIFLIAPIQ